MVPVGGAIIAGFNKKFIEDIGRTYPGELITNGLKPLPGIKRLNLLPVDKNRTGQCCAYAEKYLGLSFSPVPCNQAIFMQDRGFPFLYWYLTDLKYRLLVGGDGHILQF